MDFDATVATNFLRTSDDIIRQLCRRSEQLAEREFYTQIRQSLTLWASVAFKDSNIEVYYFGSRFMGLGDDNSDLNIFVDLGETYYLKYLNKTEEFLSKFEKEMKKNRTWKVKPTVPRSNYPNIVCEWQIKNLECKFNGLMSTQLNFYPTFYLSTGDIIIANGFPVENSKVIRHLLKIQPEFVPLYHYIRQWMKAQGFQMKGYGYTITLLLIFYLQTKKLLPTIKNVQAGVPQEIIQGEHHQMSCH